MLLSTAQSLQKRLDRLGLITCRRVRGFNFEIHKKSVGRVGFEPTTYSLKGSSSTIELTTPL